MLSFVHLKNDDRTPYYNSTKKKRGFCTIININNTDAENIQGLVKNVGGITIVVNGYCEMERGDDIEILGKWYRVHDYQQNIDSDQTRKRKDYDRFTGSTTIYLEA